MSAGRLDSRAWLAWGVAVMIPLLVARNPFVVLVVLASVMMVRRVWAAHGRQGWVWIVRLAVIFMAVGVVFNALTVHSGNQVLFALPETLPLVGGRITLNAVIYGVVSGVAIVALVMAGTTVAAGLVWSDLMRSLPARVAPLAVAGSVAWSFLPGASRTFHDIRESQAVRGHRLQGVRDLPPLIVPLLGGALEQAITMSEALESRGFGHGGDERRSRVAPQIAAVVAVASFLVVAYAVAMGQVPVAVAGGVVGFAATTLVFVAGRHHSHQTTRYRPSGWGEIDSVVCLVSAAAVAIFLWRSRVHPAAAVFNPYPDLAWPSVDLLMLTGLVLLVAPAFLVPPAEGGA